MNASDFTGGIKSKQHGVLNGVTAATNGIFHDEDSHYYDVTISAIDVDNSIVTVQGAGSSSASYSGAYYTDTVPSTVLSARFINSTTVRISALARSNRDGGDFITCTWDVIEYK